MSDELFERRRKKTMSGVIACGPRGSVSADDMPKPDLDEIERFKRLLKATAHLPTPGDPKTTPEQANERARLYLDIYPEHREGASS